MASAARLEAAQRMGASQTIDIADGWNLPAKIRAASNTPFDAVIEAIGRPETWEASVHLARKGGTVNYFRKWPRATTPSRR